MGRRMVIAGLLAALALPAQMRMTVAQLLTFVKSSIELRHPDKQVGDYLRKVVLTDRLDDRTIEDLQGLGAGPRTLEALRALRDASKDLAPPPVVAPKPPPPPIPGPSSAEQKRIIEEVRQYSLSYVKRLPDFVCTQVTRRFYDPSGLEFWQRDDVLTVRLTYFEQKEDYKVVLVNNRPTDISFDRLGGSTSSGEFGSMLKEIFEPETQADFRWERWATLRGRRMHVFEYRVSQSRSKWHVSYERRLDIVPGYRGLVYVDRDTLAVMRITLEAENIPATFPVQQAATTLDYDFTEIGGQQFILPLRAVVRMRASKFLSKNEVEFRMYRKFGAEATIKFETPEPLPDEKINEQPPKP
ncbi:MAG: hypothetical protein HY822_13405 [Acidobacteria bacterium]|nr:hypothetical protein [Acidobacteriota bacterium]